MTGLVLAVVGNWLAGAAFGYVLGWYLAERR